MKSWGSLVFVISLSPLEGSELLDGLSEKEGKKLLYKWIFVGSRDESRTNKQYVALCLFYSTFHHLVCIQRCRWKLLGTIELETSGCVWRWHFATALIRRLINSTFCRLHNGIKWTVQPQTEILMIFIEKVGLKHTFCVTKVTPGFFKIKQKVLEKWKMGIKMFFGAVIHPGVQPLGVLKLMFHWFKTKFRTQISRVHYS